MIKHAFIRLGLILMLAIALPIPSPARSGKRPRGGEATAHNAILFIGDGMGLAHIAGGRLWAKGPTGRLGLETMPVTGLMRNYPTDQLVTDSAAAATAMASGVKTYNGSIGMSDPKVDPTGQSRPLTTLTDAALAQGKSVGLITTSRVTDATPACFFAHVAQRASEAAIADQVLTSGLTLLMGGGRAAFFPATWQDPEIDAKGQREDGRNTAAALTEHGWTYVQSADELKKLTPRTQKKKVLALFQFREMQFDVDRAMDKLGEPSLAEMTAFAIEMLSQNPKGYFLMVEGGRVDHASHSSMAHEAFGDVRALDQAVSLARERAGAQTLIVVTADHETGGLVLRGTKLPREKLIGDSLIQGGDATKTQAEDKVKVQTPHSGAFTPKEEGLVLWGTNGHTGVDVPVVAEGPGARLFSGFLENTDLPRRIAKAMGTSLPEPALRQVGDYHFKE